MSSEVTERTARGGLCFSLNGARHLPPRCDEEPGSSFPRKRRQSHDTTNLLQSIENLNRQAELTQEKVSKSSPLMLWLEEMSQRTRSDLRRGRDDCRGRSGCARKDH